MRYKFPYNDANKLQIQLLQFTCNTESLLLLLLLIEIIIKNKCTDIFFHIITHQPVVRGIIIIKYMAQTTKRIFTLSLFNLFVVGFRMFVECWMEPVEVLHNYAHMWILLDFKVLSFRS